MIYKGYKEKTYCMPMFALFFNISWEFIFAFIFSPGAGDVQTYITAVWFLLDALIVGTYFLYGRKYFPKTVEQKWFLPWSVLALVVSFLFVYLISVDLSDYIGLYAAFLQNLMMSVLFIDMLVKRGSPEGQSLIIAVFKCLGTMAPTVLFYLRNHDPFVTYLGIGCAVFDLLYIAMLYRAIKAQAKPALTVQVKTPA